MPYSESVAGIVGLNYRKQPLPAHSNFLQEAMQGELSTPLLEAYTGDALRVHVLAPFSEQAHVFNLEGHQWPLEPGRPNSDLLSSLQVGALESITIIPAPGAGGAAALAGDYVYGDHREPFREAGLLGVLRVYAEGDTGTALRPLPVR
jgi:hypothetical protein